jgi:hypothetical protein
MVQSQYSEIGLRILDTLFGGIGLQEARVPNISSVSIALASALACAQP